MACPCQSFSTLPRLVWLSGLSTSLQTKGSLVWFPVRAHDWVAGQVPSRARDNHTLMFLILFLPPVPSINKWTKSSFKKSSIVCKTRLHLWEAWPGPSQHRSKETTIPCRLSKQRLILSPQQRTYEIAQHVPDNMPGNNNTLPLLSKQMRQIINDVLLDKNMHEALWYQPDKFRQLPGLEERWGRKAGGVRRLGHSSLKRKPFINVKSEQGGFSSRLSKQLRNVTVSKDLGVGNVQAQSHVRKV